MKLFANEHYNHQCIERFEIPKQFEFDFYETCRGNAQETLRNWKIFSFTGAFQVTLPKRFQFKALKAHFKEN
jgi:hypothetical protein